jgi:UDP-N-acetylmuramoylalanine--D-glutamate ligase
MLKTSNRLTEKKLALLGLGLDNRALLTLLDQTEILTEVTICDARRRMDLSLNKFKNLTIRYRLGKNFNKDLNKFDILSRSPGWPLACPGVREAQRCGRTKITSPLNIFFALCPTKNIIGVTGSKGKGTTASLIYKILRDAGRRVWLGGNIGVSPLSFLTKIKSTDYVVLELSSFQLEDLEYSPRLSVITNLFPEHLAPADPHNPNFHRSLQIYWRAKLNIAVGPQNKYLVANKTLVARLKTARLKTRPIYFSASSLPSKLIGDFNRENVGAAVAVAKILKIAPTRYQKTVANFANLEHRLEPVATIRGIKYFDNSFSTTPESTILDLHSFRAPIILIAGGADKGADFRALAKTIRQKVKFLILLAGQATPRIKRELAAQKFPAQKMITVDNMKKAVTVARRQADKGDVVLLSAACASFGMFKNYKERGNLFQQYVKTGQ